MRQWDFRLVPPEQSLEAVGKPVRLHIIGRSKHFDLFPRTHKGKNRCVLRQKYALINSRERPLKFDINLEQSSHVDTVAQIPIDPKLAAACDAGMIELFDGNWLDCVMSTIINN